MFLAGLYLVQHHDITVANQEYLLHKLPHEARKNQAQNVLQSNKNIALELEHNLPRSVQANYFLKIHWRIHKKGSQREKSFLQDNKYLN